MRDIYLYSVVVAVAAVLLMAAGAEWMVKLVSGSSEPVVLENGARYLVWNAPFYAVLGMLLSTRYALQSMGEKVLPLLSSVIEFLGKIVFVLLFIPRFEYNAVILCEPVIWCFMTIELLIAYRHDSFVFPKMKNKNNEALRSQGLVVFCQKICYHETAAFGGGALCHKRRRLSPYRHLSAPGKAIFLDSRSPARSRAERGDAP